jgi:hypothetical protein
VLLCQNLLNIPKDITAWDTIISTKYLDIITSCQIPSHFSVFTTRQKTSNIIFLQNVVESARLAQLAYMDRAFALKTVRLIIILFVEMTTERYVSKPSKVSSYMQYALLTFSSRMCKQCKGQLILNQLNDHHNFEKGPIQSEISVF